MAGHDRQRRSPIASGIVASPLGRAGEREGESSSGDRRSPRVQPRPSPGRPMGRSAAEGEAKPILPKLSALLADTEDPLRDSRASQLPQQRSLPQRALEPWRASAQAGPSSSSSSTFDRRPPAVTAASTAGFSRSSSHLDVADASHDPRRPLSFPSDSRYARNPPRYEPSRQAPPLPPQGFRTSTSSSAGSDGVGPSRSRYQPYPAPTDPREAPSYVVERTNAPRRLSPSPVQSSRQWAYVAPPAPMAVTPSDLPPRPVVWSGAGEARSHPSSLYRAPLLPDPVMHASLAPTAPPPSLSPVLMPDEGEPRTFELIIRQQPMSGRMCGFGSKDFRPLDLLPIIELQIRDKNGKLDEVASSSPNLVVQASLLLGDEDTVAALTSNPHATNFPTTRLLEGGVIASGHVAKDLDGSRACFFPFISLCVRLEGIFRLKFSLVKLGAPGWSPASGLECVAGTVLTSVVSQPFEVFSARKFPGVRESTALAKSLANQGIQVPIRNKRRAE